MLLTVGNRGVAASAKPSFDCRKATAWAEKAICVDPNLADLDRRMAEVYRRVSAGMAAEARGELTDSQREWLHTRDACKTAAHPLDCLRLSYEERLGALVDLEVQPVADLTLPPVINSNFLCEDGRDLEVVFYTDEPGRAVIVAGRRHIDLPQTTSGSGARYSDGVTTFWNKGDRATFEWANGSTRCRVHH